jgi:N-acetylmuramoyl-L-alanine amidase
VLKTATMPAVLLECGVIVNRSEEASLQTPEIQHRIAEAAAEAIMQFLHDRRIGVQAVGGSTR